MPYVSFPSIPENEKLYIDGREVPMAKWLSGWAYRKPIWIREKSGSALSGFQVALDLQGNDPSSANYVDFSKLQSDGADIRITKDDGVTTLSHWLESFDATGKTAKVWLKMPAIPANELTMGWLYYGNPSASSASNGDNTFEFFDDFERGRETFQKDSGWTSAEHAQQGVATDGTYIYLSGRDSTWNMLWKYDMNGNLQTSNTSVLEIGEDGPNSRKFNGCCVYGSYLYVFIQNYYGGAQHDLGWVRRYSTSDLSYDSEWGEKCLTDVVEPERLGPESAFRHDYNGTERWWVIWSSTDVIDVFDDDFSTHIASFTLPSPGEGGYHHYQGLVWWDSSHIILTLHPDSGNYHDLYKMEFDGSTFTTVDRYSIGTDEKWGQDISKDGNTLIGVVVDPNYEVHFATLHQANSQADVGNGWTEDANIGSIENGLLKITGGSESYWRHVRKDSGITSGSWIYEVKVKLLQTNARHYFNIFPEDHRCTFKFSSDGTVDCYGSDHSFYDIATYSATTWYNIKIYYNYSTNQVKYDFNGTETSWGTETTANGGGYDDDITFGQYKDGGISYWDNVRVRKYASPEPTAILAEEQTLSSKRKILY